MIISGSLLRRFPPYVGFATCSDYPSTQVQSDQNESKKPRIITWYSEMCGVRAFMIDTDEEAIMISHTCVTQRTHLRYVESAHLLSRRSRAGFC